MITRTNTKQFEKQINNIVNYSFGFLDGVQKGKTLFLKNLWLFQRKKEKRREKGGKTWGNDETTTTTQTTDSTNTDEPKLKNNIHSERERDFFFRRVRSENHTHGAAQPQP